ncbi:MAG: FadR family transcriptional regulator [Spirochaetes bacterium]|nr:FadR family transcriptional regulator [Spirochaetota bacterium]
MEHTQDQDIPPLAHKVFSELKADILNGTIPPGSRFPSERELTQRFGVSRITIRSAISKLSHLGFVRTVPQSGTFVNDYLSEASLQTLIEIMQSSEPVDREILTSLLELRRIIEVHAAGQAVSRMERSDAAELRLQLNELKGSVSTPGRMVELDYGLHETLVLLSGNQVLRLLFNSFKPVYLFYLEFFYRDQAHRDTIFGFYERLLQAAEMRDGRYASHIMEETLVYAEHAVKEALESLPNIRLTIRKGR